MRGKPLMRGCKKRLTRITPAGAGKTCTEHTLPLKPRDHPRRCGENHSRRQLKAVKTGSPPQVRGKPRSRFYRRMPRGITPAGAGKTFPFVLLLLRFKDHPRRCGENRSTVAVSVLGIGSPPQVRGKRIKSSLRFSQSGITPAGAGKTLTAYKSSSSYQDHPRRCGENPGQVHHVRQVDGSPPQVRGKLISNAEQCRNIRITPAGAGKT